MKTASIELFGHTYKLRVDDTPPRTCGHCDNGLIRTIRWVDGAPYHYVLICHCKYGVGYRTVAWVKGERTLVGPEHPVWSGDPTYLLSDKNYPVCQREADNAQVTEEKNTPGTGQRTEGAFERVGEEIEF